MNEIDHKKEYLKQYEKAVRQMKRSEEKITEMRLSKIMPSVGNDGMPHAHNNTDLSAYAALLDEEERRYMKARSSLTGVLYCRCPITCDGTGSLLLRSVVRQVRPGTCLYNA